MSTKTSLIGPEFGPVDSNSNIKKLVILLHGLGADGFDLISLSTQFSKALPSARFISPNGPEICDMAPPGFQTGYQWFSLKERSEKSMLEGAQKCAPVVNTFIDEQLEKYKLKEKDLTLVGFSQGTMVSLFVATRRESAIAGIIGYSGRLIGADILKDEIKSRPPVILINGNKDELVPFEEQKKAITKLNEVGIAAQGHIRPNLGHSIDSEGINIGCDFLKTYAAELNQ